MYTSSSPVIVTIKSADDKPGWLRLAWQFLRRPRLDPISMIGDNKSIMAFNLIWMFDKVRKLHELTTHPFPCALSELKDSMFSRMVTCTLTGT